MGALITKFLSLCKRASKADIVKVFSFTALSTLVKMLTGLVSVKVIALAVGPAGVALLGQLSSFSSIVMTVSSGGINSGITKYIAEYKGMDTKIVALLSTALRITVVCSLFTGAIMILLNDFLSRTIMMSPEYGYIFIIFGLTVLLYSLNMMLLSAVNGFKEFKKYVAINIANSIIGLIFTLLFVYTLGLKGALISAVTFQSVMFFITLYMIRKFSWVNWRYFKEKLSMEVSKKYFHYTMMTLVATSIYPIAQIFLRGYVISQISSVEAGWWEAMNRISGMYLMIVTSSFTVYYLPRLSELTDKTELRREIVKAYKVIVPMLLTGFLLIYLLRFWVVRILFTTDFYPMELFFGWQLAGDFLKICSWLLAFIMVAKSMTKVYIITEIAFSLVYFVLSYWLLSINGTVGLVQAYMINYILYMICMLVVFRKIVFRYA